MYLYRGRENSLKIRNEERLAKEAYIWLKVSPIVTIITLFIVVNMNIGAAICSGDRPLCSTEDLPYINFGLGVLVSECWHFLLLQYATNKDSEFVRKHGRRALIQAGIRTAVPFFGIPLDFLTRAEGAIACWIIPILIMMWSVNAATSKKIVENELALRNELNTDKNAPIEFSQTSPLIEGIQTEPSMTETDPRKPEEIVAELYQNLQSDNNVIVLKAIAALHGLKFSSEAIRQQLEKLSLHSQNEDIRKEALATLSLPANRAVQKQVTQNRFDHDTRQALLQEINDWERNRLIESQNAEVLRRKYDFDFDSAPKTAPKPAVEPQVTAAPTTVSATAPSPQPAGPRPMLPSRSICIWEPSSSSPRPPSSERLCQSCACPS